MTREEHRTVMMLLGMTSHNTELGYYYTFRSGKRRIDDTTLEPVDDAEADKRYIEYREKRVSLARLSDDLSRTSD